MTSGDDFGGSQGDRVRPLDEHGMPMEVIDQPVAKRRNPWLVGGGVAVAVLLVGAVGAWLWWSNVIRGPLGAAEVIPSSADMVFTVDALELIEGDRIGRFVNAFDDSFSFDELLTEADDEIENETGLRLFEDARTWVGRSAAVGIWAPPDLFTSFDAEVDVVISIMTRDEGAAAEFLDEVLAAAAADGADLSTTTLGGVEVDVVTDGSTPYFVTVHSGRLLMASSDRRMRELIEPVDPISDLSSFRRLWDAADGDNAFGSMYISAGLFADLANLASDVGGLGSDAFPVGSVVVTATLDDDGVEIVGASISLDESAEADPGTWGRELPSGVYGYVSAALPLGADEIGSFFDETVDGLRDGGLGPDVDDFLAAFEDQFGVSLRGLMTQFTDEILFAAVQSDFGPLPAQVGGPLGLGLGIGVAEEGVVTDALSRIPEFLGPDAQVIDQLGDAIWAIDPGDGELLRYGVVNGRLVIATDEDTFNAVLGAGGGVTDDPEWERLAGLIGDDMLIYVDIARIVDTFAPADAAADLAPLRSFGASSTVDDGVAIVTARLVIDY